MKIENSTFNEILSLLAKQQRLKRLCDAINDDVCTLCNQLLEQREEDFGFDDHDEEE